MANWAEGRQRLLEREKEDRRAQGRREGVEMEDRKNGRRKAVERPCDRLWKDQTDDQRKYRKYRINV